MQKALTLMTRQLNFVESDITAATGMTMIRAIVTGERSPSKLAEYRDARCKPDKEAIPATRGEPSSSACVCPKASGTH